MTGTRTYVAGPMRGHPRCNYDAFAQVTRYLRDTLPHPFDLDQVINPAEEDEKHGTDFSTLGNCDDASLADQDFDMREVALRDIRLISTCTHLVLLPGWEGSKGARAERAFAEWLGLKIGLAYRLHPTASKLAGAPDRWAVAWQ